MNRGMASSTDQAFATVACERVSEGPCADTGQPDVDRLIGVTQKIAEATIRQLEAQDDVSMNPLFVCRRDDTIEQWVITASGDDLIPHVCHAGCGILMHAPSRGAAVALLLPAAQVGLGGCDLAVNIVAMDHQDIECSVAPLLISGSGEYFVGQWQSQDEIFPYIAEAIAAGLQQSNPDYSNHSHLNAYGTNSKDRTMPANDTDPSGDQGTGVDELVQAIRESIHEQLTSLAPDDDLDAAVFCFVAGDLGSYPFDVLESQEERSKQFVELAKTVRESKPTNAAILFTSLDKTTGVEHLNLFAGDRTGELRALRSEIERTSDKSPIINEWEDLPAGGVGGNVAAVVIASLDNRELTYSFLEKHADAMGSQMQRVLTHLENAPVFGSRASAISDSAAITPAIICEFEKDEGSAGELATTKLRGFESLLPMLGPIGRPSPTVTFVAGTLGCLQELMILDDPEAMMAYIVRLHATLIQHPIRSISLSIVTYDKSGIEYAYVFAADRGSDVECWRAVVERDKRKTTQLGEWQRTPIANLPLPLVYPLVSALGNQQLEQELDSIVQEHSGETAEVDDAKEASELPR
jgi:hypothetical protein